MNEFSMIPTTLAIVGIAFVLTGIARQLEGDDDEEEKDGDK